jgi:hypothetical protein
MFNIRMQTSAFKLIILLGYIKDSFEASLTNSQDLFSQSYYPHAVQSILGNMQIENSTIFSNQDYALYFVYSNLKIYSTEVTDSEVADTLIDIIESDIIIDGLKVSNLSSDNELRTISNIFIYFSNWQFRSHQHRSNGCWILILSRNIKQCPDKPS